MTELPRELETVQPRARGRVRVEADRQGGDSRLARLHQSGSLRALFPRTPGLQTVLTNTSGGITGGDRFSTSIEVSEGARMTVTTQAAERAYRAQPGQTGRVETDLRIAGHSRLDWLPQETILFDGCALNRRLSLSIDPEATALLVEPVIFGRTAMGEMLTSAYFDDRIEVTRGGNRVFLDRTRLSGNLAATLSRPAIGDCACAMALIVFAAPEAEAKHAPLLSLLPPNGGASLLQPDLLVARLLAPDAFELHRSLLPVIELLHEDTLPRPWMI